MLKIIEYTMELKLSECEKKKVYVISVIKVKDDNIKQQLKNLGFVKNEKIVLLNCNYGKSSYLVKVMGINYSLDKSICEDIIVCA